MMFFVMHGAEEQQQSIDDMAVTYVDHDGAEVVCDVPSDIIGVLGVSFSENEDVEDVSILSALTTMTSSQLAQSMPTPLDTQDEEDYVHGIDGDFSTRCRFWMDASPGTQTYHIQLAAIFEAGACINTNHLEKEAGRFKEMAIKFKETCTALKENAVITSREYESMKELKGTTNKGKKYTFEVDGWPAGKMLWDRYGTIKSELRNKVNPELPETIHVTPSGKGLKKAFEEAALGCYKKYGLTKDDPVADDLDPHNDDLQEKINSLKKKPFIYILCAKVFFRHAVLVENQAELQAQNPPASKAKNMLNRNLKRKERRQKKEEMERQLEATEVRKKQKLIEMDAQSRLVKADSMLKMSNGQNMKIYAELASTLYSPDTYKRKMREQLEQFEAHTLTFRVPTPSLNVEVEQEQEQGREQEPGRDATESDDDTVDS